MTESTLSPAVSQASAEALTAVRAVAVNAGGRLRLQREALAMSIEDVASSLKISPKKIKAIEAEQWDALPTGPYLRGFLRSYAKVLRIDAQSLIDEVDASLMQSKSADSILRMPKSFNTPLPRAPINVSDGRLGRRLIYVGLAVLVLVGLLVWSGTQSFNMLLARWQDTAVQPVVAPANKATVGNPPIVASVEPNSAAIMPQADAQQSAVQATTPAQSASNAITTPAVSSSPGISGPLLEFDFQGVSWVEVKQSDGKLLMSKLNDANTHASMEGSAPLDLIIGNANQVRLQYRGQAVDLAASTHDNVARLTLP